MPKHRDLIDCLLVIANWLEQQLAKLIEDYIPEPSQTLALQRAQQFKLALRKLAHDIDKGGFSNG